MQSASQGTGGNGSKGNKRRHRKKKPLKVCVELRFNEGGNEQGMWRADLPVAGVTVDKLIDRAIAKAEQDRSKWRVLSCTCFDKSLGKSVDINRSEQAGTAETFLPLVLSYFCVAPAWALLEPNWLC